MRTLAALSIVVAVATASRTRRHLQVLMKARMLDVSFIERLRAAAHRVFSGGPVLAAYAYGSRVSGRPRPDSDLDVGYYLREGEPDPVLPIRAELRLGLALSDAIGFDVDLR